MDKTDLVYKLAREGKPYFISRPRRFGKSLLLSTMEYYFLGKKDLFKGLAIEKLEEQEKGPWQVYPVLKFDFNGQNYSIENSLNSIIEFHLEKWEKEYGCHENTDSLSLRFAKIIETAYNGCLPAVRIFYRSNEIQQGEHFQRPELVSEHYA